MSSENLGRGRRKGDRLSSSGALWDTIWALHCPERKPEYLSTKCLGPRAAPGAFIPELVTLGLVHCCGQGLDVWHCSICAKGGVGVGVWLFLGCRLNRTAGAHPDFCSRLCVHLVCQCVFICHACVCVCIYLCECAVFVFPSALSPRLWGKLLCLIRGQRTV